MYPRTELEKATAQRLIAQIVAHQRKRDLRTEQLLLAATLPVE